MLISSNAFPVCFGAGYLAPFLRGCEEALNNTGSPGDKGDWL